MLLIKFSNSLLFKFVFLGLFAFGLNSCSCTPEPVVYNQYEMWKMAAKVEPSIELVPITDESQRVLCVNYGPGCIEGSGRRIKVRKVELIAIEFDSEASAKHAAQLVDQYYFANWLLDNVKNEPVLENFVTTAFGAKAAISE